MPPEESADKGAMPLAARSAAPGHRNAPTIRADGTIDLYVNPGRGDESPAGGYRATAG